MVSFDTNSLESSSPPLIIMENITQSEWMDQMLTHLCERCKSANYAFSMEDETKKEVKVCKGCKFAIDDIINKKSEGEE